jgi:hypothetical protein
MAMGRVFNVGGWPGGCGAELWVGVAAGRGAGVLAAGCGGDAGCVWVCAGGGAGVCAGGVAEGVGRKPGCWPHANGAAKK